MVPHDFNIFVEDPCLDDLVTTISANLQVTRTVVSLQVGFAITANPSYMVWIEQRTDSAMPLRIKLPAKERIIINGAVLENAGEATTIILHNRADILRRKEVMSEEDAGSPARRIYYALQCAYMFEDERVRYKQIAIEFLNQYHEAAPSAAEMVAKVRASIEADKLYNALRATHPLIEHETELFKSLGMWPQDEDEE